MLIPIKVIELVLQLIILIIEGVPVEQRRATAIQWFYMWWPLGKLLVPQEHRAQIESIMANIGKDGKDGKEGKP